MRDARSFLPLFAPSSRFQNRSIAQAAKSQIRIGCLNHRAHPKSASSAGISRRKKRELPAFDWDRKKRERERLKTTGANRRLRVTSQACVCLMDTSCERVEMVSDTWMTGMLMMMMHRKRRSKCRKACKQALTTCLSVVIRVVASSSGAQVERVIRRKIRRGRRIHSQ